MSLKQSLLVMATLLVGVLEAKVSIHNSHDDHRASHHSHSSRHGHRSSGQHGNRMAGNHHKNSLPFTAGKGAYLPEGSHSSNSAGYSDYGSGATHIPPSEVGSYPPSAGTGSYPPGGSGGSIVYPPAGPYPPGSGSGSYPPGPGSPPYPPGPYPPGSGTGSYPPGPGSPPNPPRPYPPGSGSGSYPPGSGSNASLHPPRRADVYPSGDSGGSGSYPPYSPSESGTWKAGGSRSGSSQGKAASRSSVRHPKGGHGVAFTVAGAISTAFPPRKEQVQFEQVLTNVGEGWKSDHNRFVAPHGGLYVFSWSLACAPRLQCIVTLNHNVKPVAFALGHQNGAKTVVLQLKSKDQVELVVIHGHLHEPYHEIAYNTFSGFKIA